MSSNFVTKGDYPLTEAQLVRRTFRHERQAASPQAEVSVPNRSANLFNQRLQDFRMAKTRLTAVELAAGRKKRTEQVNTGRQVWDEAKGEMVPVMEDRIIPAIKPLPVEIDGADENGNPIRVPNPPVAKDNAERAEAQATVDATPAPVKAFDKPVAKPLAGR